MYKIQKIEMTVNSYYFHKIFQISFINVIDNDFIGNFLRVNTKNNNFMTFIYYIFTSKLVFNIILVFITTLFQFQSLLFQVQVPTNLNNLLKYV